MALRTMLVVVPLAAVAGLVLVLNSLDVGAGIAVAALGFLAVAGGAALGYFADRLPEIWKAGGAIPTALGTSAEVSGAGDQVWDAR